MSILNVLHKAIIPTHQEVDEQGEMDGATIYSDPTRGLVVMRDDTAKNYEAVSVHSINQASDLLNRLARKDGDRIGLGAVLADSTLPYQASEPAHTFTPATSQAIAAAIDAGDERLDDEGAFGDVPYKLTANIGLYFLSSAMIKEDPLAFVYGPRADGSGYATYLIHCMRHFHEVMYGTKWDGSIERDMFRRARRRLATVLPNNHPEPTPHCFPGSIGFIMGVGFDTLILKIQRQTVLDEVERLRGAVRPRPTAAN